MRMRWDIGLLGTLSPRDYAAAAATTGVEFNREAATQGAMCTTRHRPGGNYE